MDSKELYPFYEKVSFTEGSDIYSSEWGTVRVMSLLDAPYDLYRSIGRELDLIVATTRMILSGVLDDFPDLKFVISHKGGGIAALKERISYWFALPAHLAHAIVCRFDEYLEKLYFNLAGHHGGMNSVKCALTSISPTRLVFGTDYPQEFSDDPMKIKTYIENIKKLEIDEESKGLMLGKNASRLLGL